MVFLFLALHNIEEALTMKAYLPQISNLLSKIAPASPLVSSLPPINQFYFALIGATIFPLLLIIIATTGRPTPFKPYIVAVIQALVLVNVFVPHVPSAIALGGYAPGVLTAVLVNLPFSIYFFRRSLQESRVTWKGLMITMLGALPLLLLSIRLLYALSAWLIY
jgi:Protein of unknown function with HXXEE motif